MRVSWRPPNCGCTYAFGERRLRDLPQNRVPRGFSAFSILLLYGVSILLRKTIHFSPRFVPIRYTYSLRCISALYSSPLKQVVLYISVLLREKSSKYLRRSVQFHPVVAAFDRGTVKRKKNGKILLKKPQRICFILHSRRAVKEYFAVGNFEIFSTTSSDVFENILKYQKRKKNTHRIDNIFSLYLL